MNIVEIMQRFKDQEDCIRHLENLRFGDDPYCPLCYSQNVNRKQEKGRIGRWNCYHCGSSFNVLSGTIFEKSRLPLIKWFLIIALMIQAKKGISSHQIATHIGLSQNGAWQIMTKVRLEMMREDAGIRLSGIIEADETYANIRTDEEWGTGRGSNRVKILGAVERGGEVVARRVEDVSGETMREFMKEHLKTSKSLLITDKFKSYHSVKEIVEHEFMERKYKRFVRSEKHYVKLHTNAIEGFWAIYKRSLYGTHHRYDKDNTDLYLAEICYKYNNRHYPEVFEYFLMHSVEAYHLIKKWKIRAAQGGKPL